MTIDVIVEPDDRGRVSLSRLPGANAARYVGRRLSDGSIILQPAVILTEQALASLVKVHAANQAGRPKSRPLREVLDRFGSSPPTQAMIDAAQDDAAHRRANGARFLSDLTPQELRSLRGHQTAQRPDAPSA